MEIVDPVKIWTGILNGRQEFYFHTESHLKNWILRHSGKDDVWETRIIIGFVSYDNNLLPSPYQDSSDNPKLLPNTFYKASSGEELKFTIQDAWFGMPSKMFEM